MFIFVVVFFVSGLVMSTPFYPSTRVTHVKAAMQFVVDMCWLTLWDDKGSVSSLCVYAYTGGLE